MTYLDQADRAERLVTEIHESGGDALAVQSDIRDSEQIRQLFEQTVAT